MRQRPCSEECLFPPTPLQPTLRDSISLLLLRLLEEHGLLHFEEGQTLVKAVNVLMLKILECRQAGYEGFCAAPLLLGWAVHHAGQNGAGSGNT